MGTSYDKKDAAKDTNTTPKEVSKAWHQARDDAAREGKWGVPENRHEKSDSSSSSNSSSDDGSNSGK